MTTTAAQLAAEAGRILRLDDATPAAVDKDAAARLATQAAVLLDAAHKPSHMLTPLPGELAAGASKRREIPAPVETRSWWARLFGH